MPVTSQKGELSCFCVLEISNMPLSTIFLLNCEAVPTVRYFVDSYCPFLNSHQVFPDAYLVARHINNISIFVCSQNIFYCPKHNNSIRYKFFNLEHLLYISIYATANPYLEHKLGLGLLCFTPLSTIFRLYSGG